MAPRVDAGTEAKYTVKPHTVVQRRKVRSHENDWRPEITKTLLEFEHFECRNESEYQFRDEGGLILVKVRDVVIRSL